MMNKDYGGTIFLLTSFVLSTYIFFYPAECRSATPPLAVSVTKTCGTQIYLPSCSCEPEETCANTFPCTDITFSSTVTGGVPPYTYKWSAIDAGMCYVGRLDGNTSPVQQNMVCGTCWEASSGLLDLVCPEQSLEYSLLVKDAQGQTLTINKPLDCGSTATASMSFSAISNTPLDKAANVDWENPGITVKFNQKVDPATITASTCFVKYVCCPTEPISGTFSVDPADATVVKFTPSTTSGITSAGWNIEVTIKSGGSGVKSDTGEALSSDYVWRFLTLPELRPEIISTQVIDGMDLVQNKETVVRVRAGWSAASDVTEVPAKVRLISDGGSLSIENESAIFYSDKGAVGKTDYQLHGNSINFYSRKGETPFIESAGSHTLKAIIEPTGQNIIPPRTFETTASVKVRSEKTFRVMYYPINSRLTSNMWTDTNTTFDPAAFNTVMTQSNALMSRFYPVTAAFSRLRSRTIYSILPSVPEPTDTTSTADQVQINLHLKWVLFALANLNRGGAYDAVVGVVPRPWLGRLLGAVGNQQNILPVYFTTYACLIVHDPGAQISPHEIGHIYLQTQIPNCDTEGHDPRGVTFTGYDLERNRYVSGRNAGWQTGGLYSSALMDTGIDGADLGDIWISKDSYQLLLNTFTPASWFSRIFSSTAAATQVVQVLGHISVDAQGGETVTIEPVYILNNAVPTESVSGDYKVELQSAGGAVLKSCTFSPGLGTIADGTQHDFFLINIENDSSGAKVVVSHKGSVLATAQKSSNAPSVTITSPTSGQKVEGDSVFTWQSVDADGDTLSFDVLYSSDGGNTWDIIDQNLTDKSITVDTAELPGGTNCKIKVTANDGFNTTETVSASFTVQNTPQIISTSPAANSTNVPPEARISIIFHDRMDASTINTSGITLQDTSGNAVTGDVVYNDAVHEALFIPSSILSANTAYVLKVSLQVKDTLSHALDAEYTLSFTTGATPVVIPVATTVPDGSTTTSIQGTATTTTISTTTTASDTCGTMPVCGDGCCSDADYPNCCILGGEAQGCCSMQTPYCGYNGQGEIACFSSPQTEQDNCELNGWYGDGTCDTFCPKTDPDCTGGTQCPLVTVMGNDAAETLLMRQYRDAVLAVSPEGRQLTKLYYIHAEELAQLLQNKSALSAEIRRLVLRMVPYLEAAALGKPAVLDTSLKRDIGKLMDAVLQNASPKLKADLVDLKERFLGGQLSVLRPGIPATSPVMPLSPR